jgi:hypothetical protein
VSRIQMKLVELGLTPIAAGTIDLDFFLEAAALMFNKTLEL